ncbi:hypothetical protein HPB50_027981 [Hyalomma asiaticum]|nr:hypothetical protein HPB50_027981 [Hyalomma asiaticum]
MDRGNRAGFGRFVDLSMVSAFRIAAAMSSSFQKSTRPAQRGIAGTKLSPHTAETVLSCGVSAIHYIISGGVPLGGIVLVEEDTFGTYCVQLLKYYVAEGIEQQHHIYFASGDFEQAKFLSELPKTLQVTTGSVALRALAPVASDGDLKLAFRYERMAKQDSLLDYELNHVFDLSDRIESSELAGASVVTFDPYEKWQEGNSRCAALDSIYASVLADVSRLFDKAKADENLLQFAVRIALQGLCSPTWGSLARFSSFLHTLKAVIRGEPVSVFVTAAAVIAGAHPSVPRRCRRLADIVLKL